MIRKTYILLLMLLLGFSMSLINSFADEVIEGTPEFQKVPNLIFGTPDFEKMRDLPKDSQDYQLGTKVGWLYVPQTPNSGRRTCTGFLVGPDLFMTNRHCIYSGGSLLPIVGARIYMDYYQEVSVDQTRGGITARVKEVLRMDASKDYALLRLDTPIGNTYGWLELDTTTQVNSSQSVKLISHPEERSKEIVRRNSQIFDIPDWHPVYGVPFLFAYLADTVGGSSGCPVFLRDGTGVIGINHSQWERGRPKVPHFNAGTLMSHIVPEIRQWLPSGPYLPKVPDKAYTKGTAIAPYTLPPASETFAVGAVTYTLTGLPAGLAFDPTSRRLTGTPNPTNTGVTTATYTATDTASNADNVSFTITVNPVVSLVAPANFPAAGTSYLRGQPFADMTVPNATGGTGDPANYTYAVTGLPTGLTFNATGKEITGTPTAAGVSTVTITATDTVRATGSADFTITVTAAPALIFSHVVAPQTYEVGTPITQVSLPEGSGGIPPYTYALAPIPDGLSFSPTTRVLSGTPTTAQAAKDHTYTISDSAFSHLTSPSAGQVPNTRTLPINITVTAAPTPNRSPDFGNASVENIVATVGTAIQQRTLPTATDPDGDTLTYSISPALPTGLNFN